MPKKVVAAVEGCWLFLLRVSMWWICVSFIKQGWAGGPTPAALRSSSWRVSRFHASKSETIGRYCARYMIIVDSA